MDAFKAIEDDAHVDEEELFSREEPHASYWERATSTFQHYRQLFEFAPDGYLIMDAEGMIQEANRAAAALLNTSPKYVNGKPLDRFVIEEDRPTFREFLSRLREQDGAQETPTRMLPRIGSAFDARLTVRVVRDAHGARPILLCILRDASDRRQVENAVWTREERLETLIGSAPVGILQTDAERQCLYSNERWHAICGLTPEECLGYGWSRVLHPDDRDKVLRGWSHAGREGQDFSCEHRIVAPHGPVRWVHLRSTALRSVEGVLIGHVVALDDVTERRQAEDALRSSEQRFRALTERSWDAVSLLAADGTILYDNPAASTRILGYDTGEMVGQNALGRMHPDDRPYVAELFDRLVQQPGATVTAEFRYQHKDGSWRWIECAGTNLLAEPSVQAVVANYRDVTERKQAEEEIRRRNRELATLNEITAAVGSSLELSEVLATFKRLVAEELDVPGGMIFFRDAVGDQLLLQESWGLPPALLAEFSAVAIPGSHWEPVIQGKKALLVPDFREIAFFFTMRLDVARPDWQSYLCVPLLAEDAIQGVVGLFSQAPVEFSKDQLAFFEALGQQVGVALQNARLFEQVRAWRERLQRLSRRLVELQEGERQHIARELHDEIGQLLTGLRLTLEMSGRLPADAVAESLTEAVSLVNELISRVRQLSLDLRPAMLDDLGLLSALLWHFERYTAQTNVQVVFEHTGLDQRLSPAVETAAYRIVQEALTNVARHAGVSEATVRLWADPSTLVVQIEDEGSGFDPRAVPAGSAGCGLTGMRERASLLGGHLTVDSMPGVGTRLLAELPLSGPSHETKGSNSDHRSGG
jgi:PAS domain S-box-containing protein